MVIYFKGCCQLVGCSLFYWLCLLDRSLINNFNLRIKTLFTNNVGQYGFHSENFFFEKLYKKDYNFVPFCFLIKSDNLKKQFEISSFPTVFSSIIPLKRITLLFSVSWIKILTPKNVSASSPKWKQPNKNKIFKI